MLNKVIQPRESPFKAGESNVRFPMAVVRQRPLVDADQTERIERLKITKAINDSAGTEQKSPVGDPAVRRKGASYLRDYSRVTSGSHVSR